MSAPQKEVTRVSLALWGEDRADITWDDIATSCEKLAAERDALRAFVKKIAELEIQSSYPDDNIISGITVGFVRLARSILAKGGEK